MVGHFHIPGTKQWSSVLSDAVLASVAGYCAFTVYPRVPIGALGLACVSAAATAGVTRFAGIREAAKPHEKLTFLSTTAGILLLALGFLIPPSGYPDMQTAVGIAAATSVACHFLFKQKPKLEEPITLAIGFSFIGASLYRCVLGKIWGGVAGTLIFATAGLLGTDGNIKGIKKVDIFHYGVAAGIFLISQGLLQVW